MKPHWALLAHTTGVESTSPKSSRWRLRLTVSTLRRS